VKIALISDIHANLEALEAVLSDIAKQSVDNIHCLGDVIGYGCDPVECLKLVDEHCDVKLMGNHEFAALGLLGMNDLNQFARQSMDWTKKQLTDHEFALIADFEIDAVREGCYLVHSSPFEPDRWHYILREDEAAQGFSSLKQQIGFFGHSHLPMIFSQSSEGTIRVKSGHDFDPDEETRYLINVGSVGQPRDNDPQSSYVVFDTAAVSVAFRRVEYDYKTTQAKMTRAEMPAVLIERIEIGR